MNDTLQYTLDGNPVDQDIVFNCPFCGKKITIKYKDGYYYQRNWTYHFAHNHKVEIKLMLHWIKDDIPLWIAYWMYPHDDTAKELCEEWLAVLFAERSYDLVRKPLEDFTE